MARPSLSSASSSTTLFTFTLLLLLLALLSSSSNLVVEARPAASDVTITVGGASTATATSTRKAQTAVAAKSTAQAAAAAPSSTTSAATNFPTAASTVVSPLGSSSDMFVQGQACRASWVPAAASSATWKNMTIDLMTGSNLQMTKLATVAAGLDGTDANATTYNYICPSVSPNAAIYFLQYTHDDGLDPTWTTRFAIANTAGVYFPAPEANQPQGGTPAIPWGKGKLVAATTSSSDDASSATVINQSATTSSSSESSGSSPLYRYSLLAVVASAFAPILAILA